MNKYRLKIAWFTPSPVLTYGRSASGTWISSLYNSLLNIDQLEIINIVLSPVHFEIAENKIVSLNSRIIDRQKPDKDIVRVFKECVHELKPDLIHIWGTEWNGSYIAAKAQLSTPVLVSIQGIATIIKDHVKGTRKISEILKWLTLHDLIAPSGLMSLYRDLKRAGKMELIAVREMQYFECATPYMEGWVRSVNPQAKIYSCPSVLRPPFYKHQWDINKISRHSLLLPDASKSYKGFDVMLKAAKILVKEFPLMQIRVAGPIPRNGFIRCSGYERYINRLISDYELRSNIVFLGPMTSEKLSREMLSANGVVISSLIESQCLVLLEAMMLGVPTVVSYSGGMPDLFTHLQTAIGYAAGDAAILAHSIRQLFNDDDLAVAISGRAYQIAHIRNNPLKCITEMSKIYKQIIEISNSIHNIP